MYQSGRRAWDRVRSHTATVVPSLIGTTTEETARFKELESKT